MAPPTRHAPARHTPARTRIPPLDHALTVSMLQASQGVRLADASFSALRILTQPDGGAAWHELWAIGDAVLERLGELQTSWARDWLEWARYASELGGATTFSKLSEREQNVFLQAGQLVSEQSVALMELFENIEVDLLYWIGRQSPAAADPAS